MESSCRGKAHTLDPEALSEDLPGHCRKRKPATTNNTRAIAISHAVLAVMAVVPEIQPWDSATTPLEKHTAIAVVVGS